MRAAYIETSALGRAMAHGDQQAYATLNQVAASGRQLFTSALTLTEIERVILSERRKGHLDATAERELRRALRTFAAGLHIVAVNSAILERAGKPFEVEPVRTLDAIHLATVLAWEAKPGGEVAVVTRDERLRANAAAYGFEVL